MKVAPCNNLFTMLILCTLFAPLLLLTLLIRLPLLLYGLLSKKWDGQTEWSGLAYPIECYDY